MSKAKKIKPEEKVKIVRKWQAGEISISAASEGAGVNRKTIRRRIARYEVEGAAGFLPQRQNRVYPPEMKRKAVQEYLSGAGDLIEISKKYQLQSERQLRNWIKVYNAHGAFNSVNYSGGGSYMKQGRETTLEERIQIVRECMASGKNYGEMALKYQVSYQQVRNWVLRFEEMGEAGLEDRRGRRKKDQTPRTELEKAQIEIEQLKHKLYLAEVERDLLKNWRKSRGGMPFGSKAAPGLCGHSGVP